MDGETTGARSLGVGTQTILARLHKVHIMDEKSGGLGGGNFRKVVAMHVKPMCGEWNASNA